MLNLEFTKNNNLKNFGRFFNKSKFCCIYSPLFLQFTTLSIKFINNYYSRNCLNYGRNHVVRIH